MVALGADGDGDFVPQERELAGIIVDGVFEHGTVGDVDDFPIVKVAVDPIAHLHHGGAQDTNVN